MAKIRKIYDQTIKPDGSKVTIYPITSTRAVYTPESITMEALINEGYRFGGVIEHLEDSPEFTDQRVFYLADKVGVYPNFGNLTLAGGELGVFCYNKSQWIKGILKGGGTNLTGYQVVTSASLLPDEESTIGYIIGTNLYVWVGEGGDTKEGKYKNTGPFVGPQGNGIEQVFLSPTNYKLTIDFTDGTSWTSEQSIRGIAGAKGDKGDPGLTGATGATGPKGDKGNPGDSGVSLGEVALTVNLDETETGKALDASAMQTIPHWVDEEQEIEDVPSNYYTRTQTDQKLLNHKAEVNQYLTNQDNDIARLEDRIDNMVDGVDEFIHHRPTVINNGTIINAPDDEDLVATEENTLKFADRPAINAMGYVILRKNKTFAEQVTASDTIYEIRYDFDLEGESVTIPEGCVLKFVGGKIINGTINLGNTLIDAPDKAVFEGVTISSCTSYQEVSAVWFGAVAGDSTEAASNATIFQNLIDQFCYIFVPAGEYYIGSQLTVSSSARLCELTSKKTRQGIAQVIIRFPNSNGLLLQKRILIEGLYFAGSGKGTWNSSTGVFSGGYTGIDMRVACELKDVQVNSFQVGIDTENGLLVAGIFERVVVGACGNYGMKFMDGGSGKNNIACVLRDCYFVNCGNDGLVYGTASTGKTSGHGLYILGGSGNLFIGNVFEYCSGIGLYVDQPVVGKRIDGLTLIGNNFEYNKYANLYIDIATNNSALAKRIFCAGNFFSDATHELAPDSCRNRTCVINDPFGLMYQNDNKFDNVDKHLYLDYRIGTIFDTSLLTNYNSEIEYYDATGDCLSFVPARASFSQGFIRTKLDSGLYRVTVNVKNLTASAKQFRIKYTVNGTETSVVKSLSANMSAYSDETMNIHYIEDDNSDIIVTALVMPSATTGDNILLKNIKFTPITSVTSTERGSFTPKAGFVIFDSTLGKCVVYNGSAWTNLDGTALA